MWVLGTELWFADKWEIFFTSWAIFSALALLCNDYGYRGFSWQECVEAEKNWGHQIHCSLYIMVTGRFHFMCSFLQVCSYAFLPLGFTLPVQVILSYFHSWTSPAVLRGIEFAVLCQTWTLIFLCTVVTKYAIALGMNSAGLSRGDHTTSSAGSSRQIGYSLLLNAPHFLGMSRPHSLPLSPDYLSLSIAADYTCPNSSPWTDSSFFLI